MQRNYKKMSQTQKDNIYGGWGWLVVAMPFVLQSIVTTISSIKVMFTDNGSFKHGPVQSTWSTNKEPKKPNVNIKEYFYAF